MAEQVLPLNSRRITAGQMRALAAGLNLPTNASREDLAQILCGKLTEEGRQPSNVQLVVGERQLKLRDEGGVFLEVDSEDANEEPTLEAEESEGTPQPPEDQTRAELVRVTAERDDLQARVISQQEEVQRQKERYAQLWRMNCEQLEEFDKTLVDKEERIRSLLEKIQQLEAGNHEPVAAVPPATTLATTPTTKMPTANLGRRGKAPPVDQFSGDQRDLTFDDWLPTLERAAQWNAWTEAELLLQLAGHLRGRAFQEWNLIRDDDRQDYSRAVKSLKERLDPGLRTLAAQDFRHTRQKESETVTDFIRRLERTFQLAYGRDPMSQETRQMLLYGQLQEGLRDEMMKSPAVSGALSYPELCLAAKSEEQRQAELKRRQQYRRAEQSKGDTHPSPGTYPSTQANGNKGSQGKRLISRPGKGPRECYTCGSTEHLAKDCHQRGSESTGRPTQRGTSGTGTKTITTQHRTGEMEKNPLDLLYSSDSDDQSARLVSVQDKGSRPKYARVTVEGESCLGIIDTGSDITIIGGDLFKKIAALARLKKRDFKQSDKSPVAYNQQPFKLHGRMDLNIMFGEKTMVTPVYIKMDAHDQLLLSEGVCRQLDIVRYHPEVDEVNDLKKEKPSVAHVRLIKSFSLRPYQSAIVPVRATGAQGTHVLEPRQLENSPLCVQESVLEFVQNGSSGVLITNPSGQTCRGKKGMDLGTITPAFIQEKKGPESVSAEASGESQATDEHLHVARVYSGNRAEVRQQRLRELFGKSLDHLPLDEKDQLISLLLERHEVFCLDDDERGETDLVQFTIDTTDCRPLRQPLRRVPFGVRQEISQQLEKMLKMGVVQPSKSPWASPVVLVRKKDGSLRFCVDYRKLNSVTKPDVFPMPRIDDMLDQLGKSKYFSTLDLASGYWQIRMDPASQEKTAFVTPQGLFEFLVMPFGLTNAPATFQRMMQKLLTGLNPVKGPDFVSVYVDDVLIFSETLEEHIRHLQLVLDKLKGAGLKLKPSKCSFVREGVDYLGHVITSNGLSPNPARIDAVQSLPAPTNIKELRQFLGLTSYYRRFIPAFARVAAPLHALTRKSASFEWTSSCQTAFDQLRSKLVAAPILAYPDFGRDFILETDASINGLGAVLSQEQEDGKAHPVAYASRALSPTEKNYGITELETLAVVWAVTHFRYYLYGHNVRIFTDHTAVKAVLGTPQPNGKHARWWSKVFGSGIKEVEIVYRPGKENANADTLSRQPYLDAPPQGIAESEVQVAMVRDGPLTGGEPLQQEPQLPEPSRLDSYAEEQRRDPNLLSIIQYLTGGNLPEDPQESRALTSKAANFTVIEGLLYRVDPKQPGLRQAVVPAHLQKGVLEEYHGGKMAGHFSGPRLFKTVVRTWWWEGLYKDAMAHAKSCPQCAFGRGTGRVQRPPLQPIPVQRPFQIWGVDILELPRTNKGNHYAIVFQDFFTKWPLVFPAPDQKSLRITRLLAEELVPMFGVPEALLSDRGANLLSHLMTDLCTMLGIHKLNTTSYHPQCNGMVERFNRTLIGMLRSHATKYGAQWDKYLSGVLWAYRNTPHESTGEKPSFLMFGLDCRGPTEAAFLPLNAVQATDLTDYREELMMSLTTARSLATSHIRRAQKKYKYQYDRRARTTECQVGDWVLIRFPREETGANRKLAQPWHGPYRVISIDGPDVTAIKVYFPEKKSIHIHRSRVQPSPAGFPAGYYYYGNNQRGPGHYPRWIDAMYRDDDQPAKEQRYNLRSREDREITARVELLKGRGDVEQ